MGKTNFKWFWLALVILFFGVLSGILFSYVSYIGIEKTAGEQFCSSCHTMKPMVKSYMASFHGGNNLSGFRAQCTDCHLPHTTFASYLFAKAQTGISDILSENFGDTSKINWINKLKNHNEFVFDSGCLKCHSNLMEKSLSNQRAFLAHRNYFAGTTTKTCTDCHSDVGHKYLTEYINYARIKRQK